MSKQNKIIIPGWMKKALATTTLAVVTLALFISCDRNVEQSASTDQPTLNSADDTQQPGMEPDNDEQTNAPATPKDSTQSVHLFKVGSNFVEFTHTKAWKDRYPNLSEDDWDKYKFNTKDWQGNSVSMTYGDIVNEESIQCVKMQSTNGNVIIVCLGELEGLYAKRYRSLSANNPDKNTDTKFAPYTTLVVIDLISNTASEISEYKLLLYFNGKPGKQNEKGGTLGIDAKPASSTSIPQTSKPAEVVPQEKAVQPQSATENVVQPTKAEKPTNAGDNTVTSKKEQEAVDALNEANAKKNAAVNPPRKRGK